MNLIEKITKKQIRTDLPEFRVGDTVRVDIKIDEVDAQGKKKTRMYAEAKLNAVKNKIGFYN